MSTITATFSNRRPFTGVIESGSIDLGVFSARGPRGGKAAFARNVHSGKWGMVTSSGFRAVTHHCDTLAEVA